MLVCVLNIQAVYLDRMLTFRFHYANKMLSASAADDAYRLSLTGNNSNNNLYISEGSSDHPQFGSASLSAAGQLARRRF